MIESWDDKYCHIMQNNLHDNTVTLVTFLCCEGANPG